MQDRNAPPLNPLPVVVWVMALPMIAMELVLQLADRGLVGGAGGIGWRLQAVERFAYVPDLMRYFWETGVWPLNGLHRLLSYAFVHPDFTGALFGVVLLLALGKMVGEVFRWWAVLAVFFGACIVGALVYTALLPGERGVLIGAFPGNYGLIGAFTFLIWVRLAGTGTSQFRAFTLIGMLLAIQLVFGLLFGGGFGWVAELAGFATGFVLSFVVSPGGWSRVRARLRDR
ncbi:rhomboid family intramembrane serine protease [Rhodobacter sp. Har01]|uniref:rhomboid family intramembrane serine protease n=1 Tax=Rhodobacter sp. Har01 TaxID=2883999 RepID=UPI001D072F37|nr:rhomboid family intramembrane serine protease [Rhodobacter sp. Har01]MCB6179014.1 rhomboid family intramembrane serine protease [Rhodobacter sp. Har01]